MSYIRLTNENIESQHICCAIADKKHQDGVKAKKDWMKNQFMNNHTFYKLDQNGKVFIEYVDAEGAWTPIVAPNYIFIYCFWVSGSFKGKGHAKELLNYCISDAKARGKSGICVLVGDKKKPFLSDKAYLLQSGFTVADKINGYELMNFSIDDKAQPPKFADSARKGEMKTQGWVVFHSPQCPYIYNCIQEMKKVAIKRNLPLEIVPITSKEQIQSIPCVFNNFAVFYNGQFISHSLLNGNSFEKLIDESMKNHE